MDREIDGRYINREIKNLASREATAVIGNNTITQMQQSRETETKGRGKRGSGGGGGIKESK